MNCHECQDNLVAYLEGVLEEKAKIECREHLESCTACLQEHDAIADLQQRLAAHGRVAAGVSLAGGVMGRIRDTQNERDHPMETIKKLLRWGLGLSAAAGGIVLAVILLMSSKGQTVASEVMNRGVQAARQLTGIYLQCRVRTAPADNFAQIDAKQEFAKVELWKKYASHPQWRVEKPGRVAVMDGQSTLLFIRPGNIALKVPQPTAMPFDTGWLHALADIEGTLSREMRQATANGWGMELTRTTDASGAKAIITVEAKSGLPDGDYLKNAFFNTADTRRVYRFDEATGRLEALQVYLHDPAGDVLIVEVDHIEYNPSFDAATFQLALPANVNWIQEPKVLPDNAKYAAMTPEQAAQAFFEACGREDWSEVAKFVPFPFNDLLKNLLGGLKIVRLGEAFTSSASDAKFVPYEIQLRDGSVKKHNLALKKNPQAKRWQVDGGI